MFGMCSAGDDLHITLSQSCGRNNVLSIIRNDLGRKQFILYTVFIAQNLLNKCHTVLLISINWRKVAQMIIQFLTKRFSLTICVLVLIVLGIFAGIYYFNPRYQTSDKVVSIDNTHYSDEVKKTQNKVIVGVYPINVYQIDTTSNTFQMTAYVWMIWKGDIKPNETFEIMNVVNSTMYTKTEITKQKLDDGRMYVLIKIDGTFFEPFDMSNYPVDQQQLTLGFEDAVDTSDDVIYVPDIDNTKSDQLTIPGWELKQITYTATENVYQTNFGFIDGANTSNVTHLEFSIIIEHPFMYYFVKFVLPLTLILLANYIVFWMPYVFIETKIFVIGGTLLSIMFLQQLYIGKIANQQIVLIDYLYLFAYLSTFLTVISKLYFYKKIENGWEESEAVMWDKMIFLGHFVIFLVIVLGIFGQYLRN